MDDIQTTVQLLRTTAPKLTKKMEDDTLSQLIADAKLQVLAQGFPKFVQDTDGDYIPIREIATRDLALHLATMDSLAGQGVTSEKVDVIERTYADKTARGWLQSSTWGQMYLDLLEEFANGGRSRYAVIQH